MDSAEASPKGTSGSAASLQGAASAYAAKQRQAAQAKHPIPPAFLTLPAALMQLVAAAVVIPYASRVPNMESVVYASGFLGALFFVWLFHHTINAHRTILAILLQCILLPFLALLSFILWEHYDAQNVWSLEGQRHLEQAESIAAASILVALSGLMLPTLMIISAILKTTRKARDFAVDRLELVIDPDPEAP